MLVRMRGINLIYQKVQFETLAAKYIDTIYAVAFSVLKNRADAEDVTQDVLIQLYKTDKEFESYSHVKNWLIRVTVNQCKKVFRAPWRKTESLEDYAQTLGFEHEEDHDLFLTVMQLERKYRIVVVLYYYEGYSTSEIASMLGVPVNTVSTRLARARAKLRTLITEVE